MAKTKRKLGRPPENPPGSRPRAFRMTDAEFAVVKRLLKRLRAGKKTR